MNKLDIQPSPKQQAALTNDSDIDKSLCSSLVQTPCNQLILNNFGTGCKYFRPVEHQKTDHIT